VYAAVGPEEFHDMRSELPKDFHPLLSEAIEKAPQWEEPDRPFIGRFAYDEFVERVASLAEVGRDQARTVAEAVLEVLAMRVTGGQVDDLEPYLPPQLRPALRRGRARTQGRALPLSLDEFVEEVMKLEGVTKEEATAHVRAVLAVLRSAVAEKEWRDTVEQLPMDFRMLLHQL
jgi:uncharacterized protein (DUF2267 family)